MAKTPKKSNMASRSSSRPPRATAPVTFANEDEENFDEIQDAQQDDSEEEDSGGESLDIRKILAECQKQRAKKTAGNSATFENQKKAMFASARKTTKEVSREGIAYIEQMKASLLDLRKQETSYKACLSNVITLWNAQDEGVKSLLAKYPAAIEDLYVRRSKAINDASEMLKSNPSKREQSLAQLLSNAHAQVEKSREYEIVATDASKLIKHYKNLLLGR